MSEEFEVYDLPPEEIAALKRAEQDINMGFCYEMLFDVNSNYIGLRCIKCDRTSGLRETPFPHKLNCPMRDRVED